MFVNQGHIECTWSAQDYKSLPYQTHSNVYNGFNFVDPEDDSRYKMIATDVYGGLENFLNFGQYFTQLDNKVYQVTRLQPGMILPLHGDRYSTYRSRNNITDPDQIVRIIVFLEDWKSGHYLEVAGKPFVNWQAGDWVSWTYDTPHLAVNNGHDNRYTLQITGVDNT